MKKQNRLHGLYAITNEQLLSADKLLSSVEKAIDGGSRIIQLRDKSSEPNVRKQLALACQALCNARQITFIVNDDIALALEVNADGVHLGKEDSRLIEARAQLGNEKIIGISCYDQFGLALEAEKSGADYIAFGSFFTSTIKPHAVTADINLLIRAREELKIPVVAIGGITHDNAGSLLSAGADMLAVISAVFAQTDIEASAHRFSLLFDAPSSDAG